MPINVEKKRTAIDHVLILATALGGQNSAVILKKVM